MGPLIKRLVFAGGGIRVVAFLGALEVLEEEGCLEKVSEYVGVSAGGLLGFMFALGYSIKDIKELIMGLDFSIIRNVEPDLERFGLDDGANFEKLLVSLLRVKGHGADMTFGDLTGSRLRIFATDLNMCCVREFSKELTNSVRVIDAVRASCALPVYFMPVTDPLTGNLLTDGSAINNYPMIHLTADEQEESIGLAFKQSFKKGKIETIIEFIIQFLKTMAGSRNYNGYEHRTIVIDGHEYPSWNFEADKSDKEMLINAGRLAAREYFSGRLWIKKRIIQRRNSV